MTVAKRYLTPQILADLKRKMVFVAGPRQIGKTTLGRSIPGGTQGYLNWDIARDRDRILAMDLPNSRLWVFDEIHKYRAWRNYMKGLFDGRLKGQRILVTGSARLDYYRYSGDSLQGRYHLLRLHPLSVTELDLQTKSELKELLSLGGFPEPYFEGSKAYAARWARDYRNLLVREEVTSLEQVLDLGNLELLLHRLPALVGSPLSINGLREDLRVDHKTVSKWIAILERLYAVFRLAPFGPPSVKAVAKAQKHYHFDWSVVPDSGARFENLVASHLLKWVHYRQDTEGADLELRYFRASDGREVDFVVIDREKPILLVEAKLADAPVGTGLYYLQHRYPDAEAWQISATGKKDYQTPEGIRVAPALEFLKQLN